MRKYAVILIVLAACSTPPGTGPHAIAGATLDAQQAATQVAAATQGAAAQTQSADDNRARRTADAQAAQQTAVAWQSTTQADAVAVVVYQTAAAGTLEAISLARQQDLDRATQASYQLTATVQADQQAADEAAKSADLRHAFGKWGLILAVILLIAPVALVWGLVWALIRSRLAQAREAEARARREEIVDDPVGLIDITTMRILINRKALPGPVQHTPPAFNRPAAIVVDAAPRPVKGEANKEGLIKFLKDCADLLGDDPWDARRIPSAADMKERKGYHRDVWQMYITYLTKVTWLNPTNQGTEITKGTLGDLIRWVAQWDDHPIERDAPAFRAYGDASECGEHGTRGAECGYSA